MFLADNVIARPREGKVALVRNTHKGRFQIPLWQRLKRAIEDIGKNLRSIRELVSDQPLVQV